MKVFYFILILVLPVYVYPFTGMEVSEVDGLNIIGSKGRMDGVKNGMVCHIFNKRVYHHILVAEAKVTAVFSYQCKLKISKLHTVYDVNVGDFINEKFYSAEEEQYLSGPQDRKQTNRDHEYNKNPVYNYRHIAFGYVGNLPNAPIGVYFALISLKKTGVFLEIKSNGQFISEEDPDFYSDISDRQASYVWGDRKIDGRESKDVLNFGITYGLDINIAVYAGLGFTFNSKFQQYQDPTGSLGTYGNYWVLKEEKSTLTNICAGIILLGDGIAIPIGFDSKIAGISVGVCFKFNE